MGAKKGRFIVGVHIRTPAPNARTEQKNYETGILEDVEYVDKLRPRHMDSATYILNLDTLTFEKNRVDNFTVQICLEHLKKHFPNDFKQWMKKTDDNKSNSDK
jgi:hypothetical protein|tara:strand:+ start:139 stop:447 length:309 start_codon:yes stop_codon:yes gene_type:complete